MVSLHHSTDISIVATLLINPGFGGFFTLAMMLLNLIFLVCALRTNVVYVGLFMMIIPTFGLLTGEYWVLAQDYFGNAALAHRLQVVSLLNLKLLSVYKVLALTTFE